MDDGVYRQVLAVAKRIYTDEMVKQAARAQPQREGDGQPRPPAYLVELHNRLAVVTQ